MNKQQLIENGYKYIATQNNSKQTEVWAKFSGDDDTIIYLNYFPKDDNTYGALNTVSYVGGLDLFVLMRDAMRGDFFTKEVRYDKDMIWERNRDYACQ